MYAHVTGAFGGCLQSLQKDTWSLFQSKVSSYYCLSSWVSFWSLQSMTRASYGLFSVFSRVLRGLALVDLFWWWVILDAYPLGDAALFTEFVHLNTRPGVELGNNGDENEDCDSVELEKSNVLLMGPTGSGTKYEFDFFFPPYGISVRTTCLQGLQFWFLYSHLGCKDRKDITCKNTSSCCECTICRCWCNFVNTGKFIAWYSSLPVHLGNKAISYLFICRWMEAAYAMPILETWTFTKMSYHIVVDKTLLENVLLWTIFSHLGNSSHYEVAC